MKELDLTKVYIGDFLTVTTEFNVITGTLKLKDSLRLLVIDNDDDSVYQIPLSLITGIVNRSETARQEKLMLDIDSIKQNDLIEVETIGKTYKGFVLHLSQKELTILYEGVNIEHIKYDVITEITWL